MSLQDQERIMAQSPDIKATHATNEAPPQKENEPKGQISTNQGGPGEHSAASLGASAAHQGDAARAATQQVSNALRHSGAASGEVTRMTAQAGTETARRSADALAGGYRQLLDEAAERFERIGRGMARAAQETTSDLRTFAAVPSAATESLRDLQDSMAGLVSGVVQSNVRASQELFRMADPAALFDLQHRFMREYLDALVQGTGSFIRVARQAAEQTLRPLEAHIEQHQKNQGEHGRERHSGQDQGIVADVMSHDTRLVGPDDTVQQATRLMRDEDTGVVPVGEGDRLVGIVTDRDVALRLVAEGKDPARTKVRDVMTQEVKYVFEDEDLGHVADNMAEQQVRRLPVVNRNKRVVGVISLGDLAHGSRSGHYAGRAMRGIARESGRQMPGAAE
jgi:CBS domain-containing protein